MMPGHTQELTKQGTAKRNGSGARGVASPQKQATPLNINKLFFFLSLLLFTGCGTTIISPGANLTGASSKYGIQLKWDAPGGSDRAVSYDVYRELTTGTVGFQQINTSPVADVTYTDKAVQLGVSYTYVVRALDAEGAESDPSNVATVTVPSS
ncbi:MAG TPA: fibronectin type III domain-containing protein [Acidobacteriaceae bacterium]|jgi:hypothetical protein